MDFILNYIFEINFFDKISKGMLVTIEKELGDRIFSMITFLKSVGSTDQNALLTQL